MKRYSRMSARIVAMPPPMTSGKLVGQWMLARPCCHCASSGNSRWPTVNRYHETIRRCPTNTLWRLRSGRIEYAMFRMRAIFFSGQGVRAGWRALGFVGVYVALRVATQSALGSLMAISESEPNPLLHPLIRESCAALIVFFATWVMARIEKRNVFSYGYTDRKQLLRLASGTAWGFFSLSLLVCVLWQRGYLVFDGYSLSGMTAWRYGIAWALMFTLVGVTEESLTRGYLQYTLTQGIGFWCRRCSLPATGQTST